MEDQLLESLRKNHTLQPDAFARLVSAPGPEIRERAASLARQATLDVFGDAIYIRGLVEFSNYCRNDCYYCGIRCGNRHAERYRLAAPEILACCRVGYGLGFRTFVLQGGEDPAWDDARLADLVRAIHAAHPDCAVTLSAGERSREGYRMLFEAGASRYLLRHETADTRHYAMLHPASLSLECRRRCLFDLKEIGFQTGSGFMVGSPFQTPETLAADLTFLDELQPEMVGLGPFIPHRDTPFAGYPAGDVGLTLFLISLVRLMLPRALIPATTALGTIDPEGREKGVLAGANVVMPNLSPAWSRDKYLLYNDKLHSDAEAAENLARLKDRMRAIGRRVVVARGDHPDRVTG